MLLLLPVLVLVLRMPVAAVSAPVAGFLLAVVQGLVVRPVEAAPRPWSPGHSWMGTFQRSMP